MRIAIFASGRGSNAEAIIRASMDERLSAEIGLVFSNNENAGVLQRAKTFNINYSVIDQRKLDNEEIYDSALFDLLDDNGIDFIALAGYLKLIKPNLVKKYRNRITNIHPALLPSFGGKGFYGKKVHEAVLEAGCKVSGVTIHLVSEVYDKGPIISQATLPVLEDDTPESLAARILKIEHKIYPEALQLFAEGKVKVINNCAEITN